MHSKSQDAVMKIKTLCQNRRYSYAKYWSWIRRRAKLKNKESVQLTTQPAIEGTERPNLGSNSLHLIMCDASSAYRKWSWGLYSTLWYSMLKMTVELELDWWINAFFWFNNLFVCNRWRLGPLLKALICASLEKRRTCLAPHFFHLGDTHDYEWSIYTLSTLAAMSFWLRCHAVRSTRSFYKQGSNRKMALSTYACRTLRQA